MNYYQIMAFAQNLKLKKMKEFKDLEFKKLEDFRDGIQCRIEFENGYGASIVRHEYSYGGKDGLYELAITKDNDLCYTTPITSGVEGYLTEEGVTDLLKQIQELSNN